MRNSLLFFLFFCLLFIYAPEAQGQNTTLDFESGNIDGWIKLNPGNGINITQEDKHSGEYALKMVNGTSTNAWSVQVKSPAIGLTLGNVYKVSFWIRAVNGGGKGRISTGSNNQLGGQYWADFDVSNEWRKIVYNNLTAGGNSVELVFDMGYIAEKTYYIDDIVVEDLTGPEEDPLAFEHSKYLGNIMSGNIPSRFGSLWNQVTAENGGKWGSVEGTRNQMNWGAADLAYNYAKQRGLKYRYHTLVWGSQQPGWLSNLTPEEQLKEIKEYMQAVAERYPDIDYIDVVNEPVGTHAPTSGVKQGLGGNGATGWDWVINAFKLAREYFPNAKLHINDYHIMAPWGDDDLNAYLVIINLLKNRGLIDGIGIQSHHFNMNLVSVSQMKSKLNRLGATGLPIYVTELDITGKPGWESDDDYRIYRQNNAAADEETQYRRYKEKFPVFWEHASVAGVTLWGYIEGSTWAVGSGLINADGSERKAMTWLREYMASEASKVPNKFETSINNPANKPIISVYPNPADDVVFVSSDNVKKIDVYNTSSQLMFSVTNTSVLDISGLAKGMYILQIETGNQVYKTKVLKK